jgi:hypothetical protein
MFTRCSVRLYVVLTALLACSAAPAFAQFQPRTLEDPATGEKFIIEGSASLWFPSADMSIKSEQLGIPGSVIDLKGDLGVSDTKFPILDLTLKGGKHKLRLQRLPVKYEEDDHVLTRKIIYNGQEYVVGLPVQTTFEWTQTHLSYEYDFLVKNRGFGGFVLNTTLTDINQRLKAPIIDEFVHVKAPVPRIGGIARVYVVPNISITTEITGLSISKDWNLDFSGKYLDVDIYGTINFTNNVGAKFGYRSVDVDLLIEDDSGNFDMKGIYFGIVARY